MNGKSEYEKFCEEIEDVLVDANSHLGMLEGLREKMMTKGRVDKKAAALDLEDAMLTIAELKKIIENHSSLIRGVLCFKHDHPYRTTPAKQIWRNIEPAELLRQARATRRYVVVATGNLRDKIKIAPQDDESSAFLAILFQVWECLDAYCGILESKYQQNERRVETRGDRDETMEEKLRVIDLWREKVRQAHDDHRRLLTIRTRLMDGTATKEEIFLAVNDSASNMLTFAEMADTCAKIMARLYGIDHAAPVAPLQAGPALRVIRGGRGNGNIRAANVDEAREATSNCRYTAESLLTEARQNMDMTKSMVPFEEFLLGLPDIMIEILKNGMTGIDYRREVATDIGYAMRALAAITLTLDDYLVETMNQQSKSPTLARFRGVCERQPSLQKDPV